MDGVGWSVWKKYRKYVGMNLVEVGDEVALIEKDSYPAVVCGVVAFEEGCKEVVSLAD
jgi:hypothetical protein